MAKTTAAKTKTRTVYACLFFYNKPSGVPGYWNFTTGNLPGAIKVEQVKLPDPAVWAHGGNPFLIHCEPGVDGKMDPVTDTGVDVQHTLSRNAQLQERLYASFPKDEQIAYTHPLRRWQWVEAILYSSKPAWAAIEAWAAGLKSLALMGYPGPRAKRIFSDVYRFRGDKYEKVWKEATKQQIKAAGAAFGIENIIPIVMLRWHASSATDGDVPFSAEVAIDTLFYLYELCGCVAIHDGYIGATYQDWNTWPLADFVTDFVAGMSREDLTKKYVKKAAQS